MNKPLQNSTSWSDTLKDRKAHLSGLLKILNAGPGKTSQLQALVIKAINVEMANIESKLNRRK
ncbi:Lacal_2735 family protein [Pseudomonas sp. IT-P291]